MKHPDHSEWVPYLWGEASEDSRSQLTRHLESCPDCREQVAAWNRTLQRLDTWKLPKRRLRRSALTPLLRWAAAALFILGFGLGLGRFLRPASIDPKELRAEIAALVQSSFASELQQRLPPSENSTLPSALADIRSQLTNDFQVQLTEERDKFMGGLIAIAARESRQQLGEWMRLWRAAREEDRQNLVVLLRQIQKQHDADYLALRKDLETVASLTDDEMRQARLKMTQLAANTRLDDKE